MSNLGGYKTLVVSAKKFGGPAGLVATIAISSIVTSRSIEAAVKKAKKEINRRRSKTTSELSGEFFSVAAANESEDGLKLKIGDKFRILHRENFAALIEILGDDDNPYMVSNDFLNQILGD